MSTSPMLMLDCARCGERRMTHDVRTYINWRDDRFKPPKWKHEIFVQCRACNKSSVYDAVVTTGNNISNALANPIAADASFQTLTLIRPRGSAVEAPEYTPTDLKLIFNEGTDCLSIGAWNASSAMFRKIVDKISKTAMAGTSISLPDKRTQFNLKPRLAWLFANNLLPPAVAPLADCIREDANDGVHNDAIGEPEARDLLDFTVELLETIYTVPGRLAAAQARRDQRRSGNVAP